MCESSRLWREGQSRCYWIMTSCEYKYESVMWWCGVMCKAMWCFWITISCGCKYEEPVTCWYSLVYCVKQYHVSRLRSDVDTYMNLWQDDTMSSLVWCVKWRNVCGLISNVDRTTNMNLWYDVVWCIKRCDASGLWCWFNNKSVIWWYDMARCVKQSDASRLSSYVDIIINFNLWCDDMTSYDVWSDVMLCDACIQLVYIMLECFTNFLSLFAWATEVGVTALQFWFTCVSIGSLGIRFSLANSVLGQ